MFVLILLLFTSVDVSGQPCNDRDSVDLSQGDHLQNGSILYEDTQYPPNFVFQRNVSGEFKPFGCLCHIKICIRKCCPPGTVQSMITRKCEVMDGLGILANHGLDLYYDNGFRRTVSLKKSEYGLLYGRPCGAVYLEEEKWYIQEDGRLFVELPTSIPPWTTLNADQYCIDTFVRENQAGQREERLDALVCLAPKVEGYSEYISSSTCMLISCVFILATVAVYAMLPELRNLHGRVLMAYLLCLFVGFAFMATMQILLVLNDISSESCLTMTFFIYFFLLAAFFWLNVMCFDIWWTFSGKRGISEKLSIRARFCAYALYAFGVPSALTIIVIALEFSGLPPSPLLPNLKHHGCFLAGPSKLLYLYGPIVVLCAANMAFFVLTAVKITKIKQQTSVLKSKESAMHDQHRNDKQRLFLYVKLFIVMGINWLLEVISAIYPQGNAFWRYTDAYNVLIGLIIFIIFVCKKKIFRLIKKRYRQLKGEPMSRNQTLSSRTASSRDDVRLSSIKNSTN